MNYVKITSIFLTALLIFATTNLHAQENNWNYIGTDDIVSRDTFIRKDYSLIFINKVPLFDSNLKKRLIETFFSVYPQQAKLYNAKTSRQVIFIIDPKYIGVAATSGNIVRYSPVWFANHPEDIDVVTHEVMHIVQSYPNEAGPGWLTEGIADYVRNKLGVNNAGANWLLPDFSAKQNYTNAYRVTAKFLGWVESKYDKKLVKQLDKAMRSGTYSPDLWKKYTGKSVDELWETYATESNI